MPTREAERMGVAPAAKQVAEHASALARLEMELAGLELKRKVASLGLGVGLLIGAALFGLFALGFGLATIAVVLSIVLDSWLALLIVFGSLLLLAGILALVGLGRVRKGTPPVPEQAIQEAKLTTTALKSNGHS
jgi:putative superfamily III holin-X